jgi:hypothetical protein
MKHSLRLIIALVGMMTALISYYWVHKPLDPTVITRLGGALLDVLTLALLALCGGGLGRRLLPWLASVGLSRAERLALEGVIGLSALSLLVLALGLLGLYRAAAFWALLAGLLLLNRRAGASWAADVRRVMSTVIRIGTGSQPGAPFTRLLMAFSGVMLLLALLHALTPPTAFDALNYHLVGPARYLAAERVTAQPDNHFLGFPQGVEILFGMALGLFGRETAAAPLHYLCGLLGLLAVGGLTRRIAGIDAGALAVALLLSAYSLWLLFGWAYVDLALLAYGAAALVGAAALLLGAGDMRRWALLLGALAGLALGVKYTAVGLAGALALLVLLESIHRKDAAISAHSQTEDFTTEAHSRAPLRIHPFGAIATLFNGRSALTHVLLFGAAAGVVFLPWALKGLLLYQNPVYPFAFGGLNWDAGRAATFSTTGLGLLGTERAWQLAVLPLAATVFGVEKGEGFSFNAGPWLLTAPFLLALTWGRLSTEARRLARAALALAVPLLAFWIVMAATSGIGAQTRLMVMALPAAAVLGALGLQGMASWPRKPLNLLFVARALLALTLAFTLLDAARETVSKQVVPYLMGTISREQYRAANIIPGGATYTHMAAGLAELPAGSQIRLLFEPRTYDCPRGITCLGDILFDHWARALRSGQTPEQVFAGWRAAGDDYLVVFNPGYEFNAKDARFAAENALFPAALDAAMTQVWTDAAGFYTLYEWK